MKSTTRPTGENDFKIASQAWKVSDHYEAVARTVILEQVGPFTSAIELCYQLGILAPTLPGERHGCLDMRFAGLFLKRTLTDLRATWLLVTRGHTPSAGCTAAALWENALAVVCLAGNQQNTAKLQGRSDGSLPWSAVDLAKMAASWESAQEVKSTGQPLSKAQFEETWQALYVHYKWLCQIKHPTLRSAIQHARSTRAKGQEAYLIAVAPDISTEDVGVKTTVLNVALLRTSQAIAAFVVALNPDTSCQHYSQFAVLREQVQEAIHEAFDSSRSRPAFDIADILAQWKPK